MEDESTKSKLSHKQYKALLKKQKRQRQRQAAAKLHDELEAQNAPPLEVTAPEEAARLDELELEQEKKEEEERRLAHNAWLERERQAQKVFEENRKKDEARRQKLLEEQRRIQEEWEARQQKENESLNKKEQELEDILKQLDKEITNEEDRPTHNPEAPRQVQQAKRETCPFYLKTGGCRFGDRDQHNPTPPHMYSDFTMEQSHRDEYDTDMSLEYDEGDAYARFLEFYEDVLPEFKEIGPLVQFKVCCNWEPHLRGNVYVQFESEEDSSKAREMFHGRYYAGKLISCVFTPVSNWKAAICGMFHQNKCSRGKNCNFLHVFINPHQEFASADRDFQTMHRRDGQSQRGWRYGHDRNGRDHRGRSRSRERDRNQDRYHRRRGRSRSRSQSRDRKNRSERSRSRERGHGHSTRSHRSRSLDRTRIKRFRSHSRSRSRSPVRSRRRRSRSCSRSRKRLSRSLIRTKHRSPSRRHKSKSRSRSRHRKSRSQSHSRSSRSRSQSVPRSSRKRSQSRSRSRSQRSRSSSDSDYDSRKRKEQSSKHLKKKKRNNNNTSKEISTMKLEPSDGEIQNEDNIIDTDGVSRKSRPEWIEKHSLIAGDPDAKTTTIASTIDEPKSEDLQKTKQHLDNSKREHSSTVDNLRVEGMETEDRHESDKQEDGRGSRQLYSNRESSGEESAEVPEDRVSKLPEGRHSRPSSKERHSRSCSHSHKKKHKHKHKKHHKKHGSSPILDS